MTDQKYVIGQTLYVWQESRQRIIPVVVLEELVRTTSQGKTIEYSVHSPEVPDSRFKVTDANLNVFSSIGDIREFLLRRATEAIDTLINKVQPPEWEKVVQDETTNSDS